jgi:histidinol-phosphate aminotransferase
LARNAGQRTALADALRERSWFVHPSQTNFLLVDFGGPVAGVQAALVDRGVVPRPMAGYGLPGSLRITIGRREDDQRFLAALDEAMR